jgi:transposase
MAEGIEGLKDRPMPGPPPNITEAYKEQLLTVVRRRPRSLEQPYSMWTLQRLADSMAEQTGIRASMETVRLVLKAGEMVLSRPQHKVSSPDPEYLVKKRRSKTRVTG